MKRIFPLLCVCFLLFGVSACGQNDTSADEGRTEPFSASDEASSNAEETVAAPRSADSCGEGVVWSLDETGTLTVSGDGAMDDYVFNSTPDNGNPLTPWNSRREEIKTVVLEQGVTHLGYGAFQGCENLTTVRLPEGITEIMYTTFEKCSALTDITLPETVTVIHSAALSYCTRHPLGSHRDRICRLYELHGAGKGGVFRRIGIYRDKRVPSVFRAENDHAAGEPENS